MHLKDLKPGDRGTIVGYKKGSADYRRRLLVLGATPGTPFKVVRVAPLGDPIEIQVRGSFISVRKSEADVVDITVDK